MYVGLTGTIASGKSTTAKIFEDYGALTIDLDKISRSLIERGTPAYNKIVNAFGNTILSGEDIDKKKLRNLIFNDKNKRVILESILHPLIRAEEKKMVNYINKTHKNPIIIVHAALLIETESYKRFDTLIVVYADEKKCYERLIKRDNTSKDLACAMINAQLSVNKKLSYANFIIDNSQDIHHLKDEVERVYSTLFIFEKTKKLLKKYNNIPTTYYKCI
jgi:dephospho-CoA kinase